MGTFSDLVEHLVRNSTSEYLILGISKSGRCSLKILVPNAFIQLDLVHNDAIMSSHRCIPKHSQHGPQWSIHLE